MRPLRGLGLSDHIAFLLVLHATSALKLDIPSDVVPGETLVVSWTSADGDPDTMDLFLSCDGGASYKMIASSVSTASASYTITVPLSDNLNLRSPDDATVLDGTMVDVATLDTPSSESTWTESTNEPSWTESTNEPSWTESTNEPSWTESTNEPSPTPTVTPDLVKGKLDYVAVYPRSYNKLHVGVYANICFTTYDKFKYHRDPVYVNLQYNKYLAVGQFTDWSCIKINRSNNWGSHRQYSRSSHPFGAFVVAVVSATRPAKTKTPVSSAKTHAQSFAEALLGAEEETSEASHLSATESNEYSDGSSLGHYHDGHTSPYNLDMQLQPIQFSMRSNSILDPVLRAADNGDQDQEAQYTYHSRSTSLKSLEALTREGSSVLHETGRPRNFSSNPMGYDKIRSSSSDSLETDTKTLDSEIRIQRRDALLERMRKVLDGEQSI
ncbi:hypothetical protein C0995_008092 [Termitomyces sp. Mi166|nr:hypothetical protein C0995_008092 [Termitomyces sp. Mi166\